MPDQAKTPIRYTLTMTEQVIADGVAPDTDTAIPIAYATSIYCEWNTVGVTTGAPTTDVHIESSGDGTTYTNSHYATLVSACAKNVVGAAMLTPPTGARFIKVRFDVNVANIAAAEFVTLKVAVS